MTIKACQITKKIKELEEISTLKINELSEYKSLMIYKIEAFKKLVEIRNVDFAVKFYLTHFDNNSNAQLFARLKSYFNEPLELFKHNNSFSDFNKIVKFYNKTYNLCKVCGKPTLTTYCSSKCAHNDIEVKNKTKQTNLERYGCENTFQYQEFKDKANKSRLEKYGFRYSLENPSIYKKSQSTMLEKYDCEHGFENSEIQKKCNKTNLEKYGNEHFSESVYFKDFKSYQFKTLDEFKKVFDEHLNNKTKEYILENFVKDNKFEFKQFQEYFFYSLMTAYKEKEKLGIDIPNVNSKGTSQAEIDLFNWIPAKNKESKNRNIITPLELDIYLKDYNLAIEYDGSFWHSDLFVDKNYHLNKTLKCLEHNIQLFHIFEFDNLDIWKSMISNKLKLNKKIYARKCIIKELKYDQVKDFLDQNHLQGGCVSNINVGLFYNNILIEVMTFSKPRFNKQYDYELIRLCTLKYYYVIGGASKLFKYFKLKYNPTSIISYANRRFSNGSIYNLLGFELKGTTNPNYYYIKGNQVLSRYKCQKHKLKDLLENYDDNLSEYQNMINNGYVRLFDCGNLVFQYKKAP